MSATRCVWVLNDQEQDGVLVTGRGHDDLVREVAPDARWSRTRGGWIIRAEQLPDLAVLCHHLHVCFRERVVK